jgi:hypothetical protein
LVPVLSELDEEHVQRELEEGSVPRFIQEAMGSLIESVREDGTTDVDGHAMVIEMRERLGLGEEA